MSAGGVAVGLVEGALGAARAAGAATTAVTERDNRVAEVISRDRLTVFFGADTIENVPVTGREVPRPAPPRTRIRTREGDTDGMKLSRPVSWFLLAFGVWSWVIWITFVKNLVKDSSGLAFDNGHPTAYFWVHLLLAIVSFVLGTVVGVIGLRGLRALRRNS
jgi:F0F1-type ATP synthase membrane subunit c/vacuolar-type H+-ATPase subunit K